MDINKGVNFHLNLDSRIWRIVFTELPEIFRWQLHIFLWTSAMLWEEGRCQNSGKNIKSVVWHLFGQNMENNSNQRHFTCTCVCCHKKTIVWYFLTKLWIRFLSGISRAPVSDVATLQKWARYSGNNMHPDKGHCGCLLVFVPKMKQLSQKNTFAGFSFFLNQ